MWFFSRPGEIAYPVLQIMVKLNEQFSSVSSRLLSLRINVLLLTLIAFSKPQLMTAMDNQQKEENQEDGDGNFNLYETDG